MDTKDLMMPRVPARLDNEPRRPRLTKDSWVSLDVMLARASAYVSAPARHMLDILVAGHLCRRRGDRYVFVPMEDLAQIQERFGTSSSSTQSSIREQCRQLVKASVLEGDLPSGWRMSSLRFIEHAAFVSGDGERAGLHAILDPTFCKIVGTMGAHHFVSYKLSEITDLPEFEAGFYSFLRSHLDQGYVDISIREFRAMFKVTSHQRTGDLLARVIRPAIKRINAKTKIRVVQKHIFGRRRTITGFRFEVVLGSKDVDGPRRVLAESLVDMGASENAAVNFVHKYPTEWLKDWLEENGDLRVKLDGELLGRLESAYAANPYDERLEIDLNDYYDIDPQKAERIRLDFLATLRKPEVEIYNETGLEHPELMERFKKFLTQELQKGSDDDEEQDEEVSHPGDQGKLFGGAQ